jgi:hypothetical protein
MSWKSTTKDQGIISKQKVRENKPTTLPIEKPANNPPLTVAEIILPNASIKLTNNTGGQEIPFSQTTRAIGKACWSDVYQNQEIHQGYVMNYPKAQFLPKTMPPQHIQQKVSINMIIRFFKIHFANNTRLTKY